MKAILPVDQTLSQSRQERQINQWNIEIQVILSQQNQIEATSSRKLPCFVQIKTIFHFLHSPQRPSDPPPENNRFPKKSPGKSSAKRSGPWWGFRPHATLSRWAAHEMNHFINSTWQLTVFCFAPDEPGKCNLDFAGFYPVCQRLFEKGTPLRFAEITAAPLPDIGRNLRKSGMPIWSENRANQSYFTVKIKFILKSKWVNVFLPGLSNLTFHRCRQVW